MENLNLSKLSLKELQQLKKDWWDNSIKEEIQTKLELITQNLGSQKISYDSAEYSYHGEELLIMINYFFGEGGFSLAVYYKSKLVYSRDDKLFVPGDWTAIVDYLYDKVTVKERQDLINQLTGV